MGELVAFLKTFPTIVKLIDGFVETWQNGKVTTINNNYQEKEEQREAIIWAMEKAREARDLVKLRALNRSLAALDGSEVVRPGPVQPPQGP